MVVEQGSKHPDTPGVPVADDSKHLTGKEGTSREELVDIPETELKGDVGTGVKATGEEGLEDEEHRRSKLIHLTENVLNFPAIHSAQHVTTIVTVGHLGISSGRVMMTVMMQAAFILKVITIAGCLSLYQLKGYK